MPDQASFDFTVETRADTAKAALAKNAAAATAVIAAVKGAGVPAADMQTSQVSLSPQTNQDGTQIVGYVASNSISVKTTIAKAGGARRRRGRRRGRRGLRPDALPLRPGRALPGRAEGRRRGRKSKAEALADGGGLSLAGVQAIVEGCAVLAADLFAAKADAAAAVPIEPGTQTVEATVTVTYECS